MEAATAGGDPWTSLYFVPVIGVFALAGAVYWLSFRSKEEDDNQSLRIYLNVLSGDDEKTRKAAKKLRKFGTITKRLTAAGSGIDGDGDGKQVDDDSDTEKRIDATHANPPVERRLSSRKPTQSSSKKADPPAITTTYSSSFPLVEPPSSRGQTTPRSPVPEVLTDAAGEPVVGVTTTPDGSGDAAVLPDDPTSPEVAAAAFGWHKAQSRREKKHSVGLENKTTQDNHSTTSDESRPSFRNSNSSRNSSPYRNSHGNPNNSHHQHHHHVSASPGYEARKFTGPPRKTPHLLQRPDHLKLEPSSSTASTTAASSRRSATATLVVVSTSAAATTTGEPRPIILLSQAPPEAVSSKRSPVLSAGYPSFRIIAAPRTHAANDHLRSAAAAVPPGQADMCVQTEESEEYPSPLEGLRQVDAGKPRFVICHDFQMQVDLDNQENATDSDSELRFEDGDKILYSSGASLSSGEGSSRVTPVLEEDYPKMFTLTAEKSQGVHPRNQFYTSSRLNSRQSTQPTFPSRYPDPNNMRNGDGKRGNSGGGGGTAAYYVGHNDLRTCRGEKGASDSWIDNSSRRGAVVRPAPVSGRWRN